MNLTGMAIRKAALLATAGATFAAIAWGAFISLDRAFPPPLPATIAVSTEVVDRDGALLRAFATADGRWRLATNLDQVDPQFIDMLVAYEDKRFWEHDGVSPCSLRG
jgi:penicillin-binding protein 1C